MNAEENLGFTQLQEGVVANENGIATGVIKLLLWLLETRNRVLGH
jgi:hypothetical protein